LLVSCVQTFAPPVCVFFFFFYRATFYNQFTEQFDPKIILK